MDVRKDEKDDQSSTNETWWSWFSKVQDDQRIERLQRCRQLQDVLVSCQTASQYDPLSIESFSGGLRTMKYFGWRGIISQQNPENEMPQSVRHAIVQSCAREQHALWACRAVAVGCGKELGALKAGFDQMGDPFPVLFESKTSYEEVSSPNNSTSSSTRILPCAQLQSTLGACVRKGADELLERTNARRES